MRHYAIVEPLGSRSLAAGDFPLSIGGPGAAVRVPGLAPGEVAAHIGLTDDGPFLQPAAAGRVRSGAAPGAQSTWLRDGEHFEIGGARLRVDAAGDDWTLVVEHGGGANDTAPPLYEEGAAPLAGADVPARQALTATAFEAPAGTAVGGGARRRWRGADPRRLALLNGLRLPAKFLDKTLDLYRPYSPPQARALARARRFVDEFVPRASGVRALLFCGPPGTGKTHLLTAMLRELALKTGLRGRYEEFFLLLSDIRDGFSRGLSSREWLEPLRSVEVLAIDEIGKGGKNREFEQGVLDEIISFRYNAGRPTLLATNYPRAGSTWKFGAEGEISETLEQRVGARIFSRLHDLCDVIDVVGPDHRKEQHDVREARSSIVAREDPHGRGTRSGRG